MLGIFKNTMFKEISTKLQPLSSIALLQIFLLLSSTHFCKYFSGTLHDKHSENREKCNYRPTLNVLDNLHWGSILQ